MKLRAPPELGGPFSHKGRRLDASYDGIVDASDSEAAALAAHGFRPLSETSHEANLVTATREELVARALARTRAVIAALSTEDLRARLAALESLPPKPLDESRGDGAGDGAKIVGPDDVEAMNRIELFAFLRARGAPAALPIRNEELRARARAILARTQGGG